MACGAFGTGAALDVAHRLALAAALVLAQLDGAFVVLYTQVWLALLAGIALGCWRWPNEQNWGQLSSVSKTTRDAVSRQGRAVMLAWRRLMILVFVIAVSTLITAVAQLSDIS